MCCDIQQIWEYNSTSCINWPNRGFRFSLWNHQGRSMRRKMEDKQTPKSWPCIPKIQNHVNQFKTSVVNLGLPSFETDPYDIQMLHIPRFVAPGFVDQIKPTNFFRRSHTPRGNKIKTSASSRKYSPTLGAGGLHRKVMANIYIYIDCYVAGWDTPQRRTCFFHRRRQHHGYTIYRAKRKKEDIEEQNSVQQWGFPQSACFARENAHREILQYIIFKQTLIYVENHWTTPSITACIYACILYHCSVYFYRAIVTFKPIWLVNTSIL